MTAAVLYLGANKLAYHIYHTVKSLLLIVITAKVIKSFNILFSRNNIKNNGVLVLNGTKSY